MTGGGVFVAVELWCIHGDDRKLIMVRRIAFGRTRAAIAGDAEISAALHRALTRVERREPFFGGAPHARMCRNLPGFGNSGRSSWETQATHGGVKPPPAQVAGWWVAAEKVSFVVQAAPSEALEGLLAAGEVFADELYLFSELVAALLHGLPLIAVLDRVVLFPDGQVDETADRIRVMTRVFRAMVTGKDSRRLSSSDLCALLGKKG